jgi:hypothetical protein
MPRINNARVGGQGRDPHLPTDDATTAPGPMLITSGPTLCRLRVWTEDEWGSLPEARRPARHAHVPGLGWVGASPIACLN